MSTRFPSLLIKFIHRLRNEGLAVGVQETIDSFRAANTEMLDTRLSFKTALRAICCTTQEEITVFNRVFDDYWRGTDDKSARVSTKIINPAGLIKMQKPSLVMMGEGKINNGRDESKTTSGAHISERLRKTDFSKVTDIESSQLDQLAERLFRELGYRLRRRQKINATANKLDFRRTFRKNVEKGGMPLKLMFKGPKLQKDKLVLFLDVSGSMDKYSFFLLRFIFSLKLHFRDLEIFVFSTRLLRISKMIQRRGVDSTIKSLNKEADLWSGGTRIGCCFQTFNKDFSRYLNRNNTVVIVASDGLDTGDPLLLANELRKIKMHSKKLIWVNPLKGMKDYTPVATGMKTALPLIDKFTSSHNLDSLLKLEKFLINA